MDVLVLGQGLVHIVILVGFIIAQLPRSNSATHLHPIATDPNTTLETTMRYSGGTLTAVMRLWPLIIQRSLVEAIERILGETDAAETIRSTPGNRGLRSIVCAVGIVLDRNGAFWWNRPECEMVQILSVR